MHPPSTASIHNDVAFYRAVSQDAGGDVLEIGCGTGRVGLELAASGISVTGLDSSIGMLDIARDKAANSHLADATSFVLGDMRDFDLGESYSAIFVPFRCFQNLLDPDDQRKALSRFRAHLQQNGVIVVHMFDPDLRYLLPGSGLPNEHRSGVDYRTGRIIEADRTNVEFDQIRQLRTDFWRYRCAADAEQPVEEEVLALTLRWTFRSEMRLLFELEGLNVISEYSDFQRSSPEYGKEQIWICRRN